MIIVHKTVEYLYYIEEEEITKRSEDWGESVESIVEGLENQEIDIDEFSYCEDYEVTNYSVCRDK